MNFKSSYATAVALGAAAMLALGFGLSEGTRPPVQPAEQLNKFERAQSQITLVENQNKSSGTGFVIFCEGKVFVWTAAHVVSRVNETSIVQLIPGGDGELTFRAKVIARDNESDLAVLWIPKVSTKHFKSSKFSRVGKSRLGDPVYHAGNFLGRRFDNSVSYGIISRHDLEGMRWKLVDQAQLPVIFGCSGGPLFDEQESVIGIIVGMHGALPGMAFFIPVREIESFAKRHQVEFAFTGLRLPSENKLQWLVKSSEIDLTPPTTE